MAKSVYELFSNTANARKDKTAAQIKVGGVWKDVTQFYPLSKNR